MESPGPLRCFECGAALGGHHWRACVVCGHLFCRRHLIVAAGTATCAACQAKTREDAPSPERHS